MKDETFLSEREEETYRLIYDEELDKQVVAEKMGVSYGTVDTYDKRIQSKIQKAKNTIEKYDSPGEVDDVDEVDDE